MTNESELGGVSTLYNRIVKIEAQGAAAFSLSLIISGCLATGTVKVH